MNKSDHNYLVFYEQLDSGCILLTIYVDDIVIIRSDKLEILKLRTFLQTKYLGALRYFIGIEIAQRKKRIFLSPRKYILDLLGEIGMLGSKPYDTSMIPNSKLQLEDGELLQDSRVVQMVGRQNELS